MDAAKEPNLGERLESAYSNLRYRWDVWDFCCDHGYLGKKALHSGKFKSVHFVDKVEHIANDLSSEIEGSGTATIHCTDITQKPLYPLGNLVFFGIGSKSMIEMLLRQCPSPIEGVRLIVCPNKNPELLREYLRANNWKLVSESLTKDARFIKEVIVCEAIGETIQAFGNNLESHPLYAEYIKERTTYYESLPDSKPTKSIYLSQLEKINTHLNS